MPDSGTAPHEATVVGGGPAGLMAAEVLARGGVRVTVYDHMRAVGRKFLLAGRGGLNLTHSEPFEDFLDRYGSRRPDLERALRGFTPDDLRWWCGGLGESTFIGSSGRVFPESFKATPLLRNWLRRLDADGVRFATRHRWRGWVPGADGVADGRTSRFSRTDFAVADTAVDAAADVTVFALGGASWPRTGSDGGWVQQFVGQGIDVRPLRPANCGVQVRWSDLLADRFAGVPLKNVAVGFGGEHVRGDAMITRAGLEGGPVYALSAAIREELDRAGRATVLVDLQPDLTADTLAHRLTRRRPKDSLSTTMRRAGFSPVAVSLLREATDNDVPSDPHRLAGLAKAVPVEVHATMPIERAISTAGGVAFAELDDAFMLRRMPGSFVAGEMLDWEAPTGGYLLQAAFSTAVAAAQGALEWLSNADSAS